MEKNAGSMVAAAERLAGDKRITKNLSGLKRLADSKEVRRLVSSLGEEELSALCSGGGENAPELLKGLLSSPEGRALVKKVGEITGAGKE